MRFLKKRLIFLVVILLFFIIIVSSYKILKNENREAASLPETVYMNVNGSGNLVYLYYDENHSSDTWYLFIPAAADMDRSVIEYSGAACIVFEDINGNKYIQKNSKTLVKGLRAYESYYMEFLDNSGNEIDRKIFQYMQSENLASLFINTKSGTIDRINEDKLNEEEGSICLYDEDGKLEYKGNIESLKGRGNTSWTLDKKPYRFHLQNPVSLLGLKASDVWVLLANSLDKSNIRNKTANSFAKGMDMEGVTFSKYADLYLNGRYNGLYELSEKIGISEGSVDIEDLEYQNEILNSREISSYPVITLSENESKGERVGYDLDRNPADITGGYLIEKNYLERYSSSPSRFTTVSGEKYCVRSPEYASIAEVNYIADLMDEFEKTAADGGDVSKLIDIKSFADKYLLEEFVDNEASGATSSFFYKDSDSVDPLLYAGPPWDYDKSLWNLLPGENDDIGRLTFLTNHGNGTRIFYNLFNNCEEFRETVYHEYREAMEPMLAEYIAEEGWKNNEYSQIDDRMDMMRWTSTPESTESEIEKIGEFVKKRKELFDKLFKDGGKICTVHFIGDFANRDPYFGYAYGSELGELPLIKEKEGMTAVWINSENGEELTAETRVTEKYIEALIQYH